MSTTVLAEYMDMMFTKLHLRMGIRNWWLEMRPNTELVEPKGIVAMACLVDDYEPIKMDARMNAVEKNVSVPVHIMEEVVDHFVDLFMEKVHAAEEGR